MQGIYRLNGTYFGYLRGDKFLYRRDGRYIGWLDGQGQVFNLDGSFLGSFKAPHIVRLTGASVPPRQMAKPVPPAGTLAPVTLPPLTPTTATTGMSDALEKL